MEIKKYENDFDNTNIHSVYNKSRNLSAETMNMWMNAVAEFVKPESIDTIIDLGCGTGRFTKALSEKFNCNVTGVDQSVKMLSVAKETVTFPGIEFIQGDSNSIPFSDDSTDLIFLSQVYHHISDLDEFVREAGRVLRKNGYVCIRNSTIDNMDTYLYPKFFPTAYEIDMNRMPARKNVLGMLDKHNFNLISCRAIEQKFAENHIEYYEKISMRGCSDLAAIDDNEFSDGLKKLMEYCFNIDVKQVFEETDLFIFQKT